MQYVFLLFLLAPLLAAAEQDDQKILQLARDVIEKVRYAALISVDGEGQPRSRIVDAFKPEKNFVVYVATRPNTRKVAQIRQHDEVTLFYFDPEDKNTVSVMGRANLIEDEASKHALRREVDSERLYPNFPNDYLLIRIEPKWLEGLLPGYRGDRETWQQVKVMFPLSSAR
ncbi:MAG TPA: pyridoxamine 5'-phosphate oxidase family protein [Pseudomonadales bacterium]|nr:pyridoxamine 5'-phosphate oxidase family protein [Pseudomonadales bacterium]MDP6314706.1 pyridoxamine 5'-phosphate oxidase family protein [Pseudomonadales bacterium]MDP7313269.1 pyridoxamine 5'-phosphate oxidase family protein [Pseudomonadales bacterium]HJL61392.1 pyridoxamine 5'-phosphate oxidase family protein [Pseudomonadales bacterium]HJP51191.1 pyridoxamine 5'-phosphate oxidase family protein [Pseudomonadales bacterium]